MKSATAFFRGMIVAALLTGMLTAGEMSAECAAEMGTGSRLSGSIWRSCAKVRLTDPDAIPETGCLYAVIQGIRTSDYRLTGICSGERLFAEQWKTLDGSFSRKLPAVIVTDTKALINSVMPLREQALQKKKIPSSKAELEVVRKAAMSLQEFIRLGAVTGVRAEMPNAALVSKKGKTGSLWDFSEDTAGDTTDLPIARVLPGGDLNPVFTAYLDIIAEYALQMQDSQMPLLFYPFPESGEPGFWWGTDNCSDVEFKRLYRYTTEYMRDVRAVHNLLFVYTPHKIFSENAGKDSRYPGDAFVDLMGFPAKELSLENKQSLIAAAHEKRTVTAAQMPECTVKEISIDRERAPYGYFLLTGKESAAVAGMHLRAKMKGNPRQVEFLFRNETTGNEYRIAGRKSSDGVYYSVLSRKDMQAIGTGHGTIDLMADGVKTDSMQLRFGRAVS